MGKKSVIYNYMSKKSVMVNSVYVYNEEVEKFSPFLVKDRIGYRFKTSAPLHARLIDKDNKRSLVRVNGLVLFCAPFDKEFSMTAENPRFSHLMSAARKFQKVSGDYHHVFLEGGDLAGDRLLGDGRLARVVEISLGS